MDTVIVTALTGIVGSLLGGSASMATAWVTQRTSNKRKQFHAEFIRRETLYGQFINECSAGALDSFENTLEKGERLLSIYSLLNRIRLCASDAVLTAAEGALAAIAEQYFRPNIKLEQLRALIRDGANADPAQVIRRSLPRRTQIDAYRFLVAGKKEAMNLTKSAPLSCYRCRSYRMA